MRMNVYVALLLTKKAHYYKFRTEKTDELHAVVFDDHVKV